MSVRMAAPGLPPLVDTHAHLADPGLTRDLVGVLERARTAGVVQVVAIGTDAVDSALVVELARAHRGIFAAVGVHPNDAARAKPDDWAQVTNLCGPRPRRRHRRNRPRPLPRPHPLLGSARMVRATPRPGPPAEPARRHPLPR